jgi:hypothetical protein
LSTSSSVIAAENGSCFFQKHLGGAPHMLHRPALASFRDEHP